MPKRGKAPGDVVGREACVPHYSLQLPRLAPPPSPTTSHCNSLHPPQATHTPESTLFRKKEEGGSGFRWRWTRQGREWRGKGNPKRKVFPHLPQPRAPPPSPTNQPPPRFLKITQTSLPRSRRDRERGTAPHKKGKKARIGWAVGGALHPRPS